MGGLIKALLFVAAAMALLMAAAAVLGRLLAILAVVGGVILAALWVADKIKGKEPPA